MVTAGIDVGSKELIIVIQSQKKTSKRATMPLGADASGKNRNIFFRAFFASFAFFAD